MKTKRQIDEKGYMEGYHTGLNKGYKLGIEDALITLRSLMESNNLHMADSEFYLEMQNLIDEGYIIPRDKK